MANAPQMKIPIGADTQDFEKGAKRVKQGMRDLDRVSSDTFSAIGNALGIDISKAQQFSSAIMGLSGKFGQAGQAGTSAFGAIAKSIAPVAAGIAGLGLAAAIAAFKKLNAEADTFEGTIQGGVIAKQTEAYIDTFRQSLRDSNGYAEGFSETRGALRQLWEGFKATLNPFNDVEDIAAAAQAAERAKQIAAELYNIELKQKGNAVEISQIDADIAKKREIISDATKSAAERSLALSDAQELIKKKLDLQLPLAEKQRDLIAEYNGLASTTVKDYEAEIAAKVSVNNLIQQEAAEQRQLLRQQTSINTELQKEAELRSRTRGGNVEAIGAGPVLGNSVSIPTQLITPSEEEVSEFKEHIVASLGGGITVAIALDPDSVEKIRDVSREVASVVEEMSLKAGEAIGQLVGNLINGEDPWGSFANSAISALGDLAISVGKIAVSAGLATLGISAALKSMNGYVAIAAGVALIALGYAVKTSMSNVASGGNYSSSMGTASSGTSSSISSNNYEQRDVYVNVTGTLRADGNQLVAVLNNTNKRNNVTT